MFDFLTAFGVAFGIIFVAELGDKTQLLALGFGARHSLRTVVVGLTLGYATAGAIATVVGGVLGAAFPDRPVEIVGGAIFLLFAALALRADDDDDPGGEGERSGGRGRALIASSAIMSIAIAIAVAEMGDKTQIATAALAARTNPVATWIGATAGEVCSGMVGAFAGRALGARLRADVLRWCSAALFAVFGVVMLVGLF